MSFSAAIWFNGPLWNVAEAHAAENCDQAFAEFSKSQWAPPEKETRYYLNAIDLCPGFIRPYELVGNFYRTQGNYQKAIEYFKAAAELGSTNHKLYYLLAELYYNKNNYTQALQHLNQSLSIREDYPKAIKLQKKISLIKDVEGPLIKLYEPSPDGVNRVAHFYDSLSFRGLVNDQSGIALLNIDKVSVPLDDNGRFLSEVPLKNGMNIFVIECMDEIGNVTRKEVKVHRAEDITDTQIYRKSFAVIIGIDEYEKIPGLGSAVSDAKAVHSIFKDNEFQDITLILNKQATQRRILSELYSELPKKIERDDRVVFYFAGHGMTLKTPGKPEKGYILPVESSLADYPDTAISMSQIRDLCGQIRAKHIMFIMDCCYAGQIVTKGQRIGREDASSIEYFSHKRVIQIITAGGKDQAALEGEEHGLFTQHFLQAIIGQADFNSDKVVTGGEIGKFIVPLVSNISGNQQTPIFAHIEGEGDVLFFYQKGD